MGLVSSLLTKLLRKDTAASAERRLAMSEADLNQIEAALEVRLPESYRSVMLALPMGQYDGYSLHEDVSKIVSRTKEQRSGYAGGQPWPHRYVYIGDEDDACPYALDCESGSVTYTDHGNLAEPLARFGSVTEFLQSLDPALRGGD
jgi:hypothetical protein